MEQHFPKLEPVVTLPHESSATFGKTKSYIYYKALHDLKEVTHHLNTVNNRLKVLTSKQFQANHPISEYFQKRGKKMKILIREWNQKSQQQLQKKKEKDQQQITHKMVKNEATKIENSRRKERAKRMITEEKYKSHDSVRQCSLQNSKAIQNARIKNLIKKKEQYEEIVSFQKKSRSHIRQLSLSKISNLIEDREAQTNKIFNKLKQKQRVLIEKKEQCFLKEANLEKMLTQKRKPRRAYPKRMFTEETKSTVLFGTETSGTPKSALSFVIIP